MIKNIYKKTIDILDLSFHMAKTNFKLRNEGSYLGVFWYMLEPIVSFSVLLIVGGILNQKGIPYYPIYLFIGLIMFNFFTASTNHSSGALLDNAGFIKNIKINPEVFIISGTMQFIFSHIFEFILVIALGIYLDMNILWFALYPVIMFFFSLFVIGISFIISIINVYIIDFRNIWSILTRLLWFATPVFYVIPNDNFLHDISMLNPMYHFINITRDIIISHKIVELKTFIYAFVSSVLVFVIGLIIFEINKNKIAEKI